MYSLEELKLRSEELREEAKVEVLDEMPLHIKQEYTARKAYERRQASKVF